MSDSTDKKQPKINLIRGWPAPDLLPAKLISDAFQRVLADPQEHITILEYGGDEGYQPLRERLAFWLGGHYNVPPDWRRICITGGASQNLACILQSFTDPSYTLAVWMITPTYHLAAGIFADSGFGSRLHSVPEDHEGVDLDHLESGMSEAEASSPSPVRVKDPGRHRKLYRHVVYAVPTCANPSGRTMTLRRRKGLVELARRHDALVITDDVYDFLQWRTGNGGDQVVVPLPRLCDIDAELGPADHDPRGFGHAVSNGSFSKLAGPGVRTGWTAASPAFALGLSKTGSTVSGGAPSQLCAGMLADLLRTGGLEEFIQGTTRPALRRRHGVMMDAVRRHLAPHGVSVYESDVYGGYFVWLTLGRDVSATQFAKCALEEGIMIAPGTMFAVGGGGFDGNVRLSFSWEAERDIVEAVRRLGDIIKRLK